MHSVLRVRLNLGPSYDLGVGHFCAARLQREIATARLHPHTHTESHRVPALHDRRRSMADGQQNAGAKPV